MKRVLITGTEGFIGSALSVHLMTSDYDVVRLDVKNSAWQSISFSTLDVVVHAAGLAHVSYDKQMDDLYYSINRDLTLKLAAKAKKEGVTQFIFLSSMLVYGESKAHTQAITEVTPLNPSNAYAQSKLEAEEGLEALESEAFKVTIVRLPMVYGPNSKGNYPRLASLALKLPMFPKTNNQRSMISLNRLVHVIEFLIAQEHQGLYFPQNPEYVNTSELVKTIRKVHGKNTLLIPGTYWLQRFIARVSITSRKLFCSQYFDQALSRNLSDVFQETFEASIIASEGVNHGR